MDPDRGFSDLVTVTAIHRYLETNRSSQDPALSRLEGTSKSPASPLAARVDQAIKGQELPGASVALEPESRKRAASPTTQFEKRQTIRKQRIAKYDDKQSEKVREKFLKEKLPELIAGIEESNQSSDQTTFLTRSLTFIHNQIRDANGEHSLYPKKACSHAESAIVTIIVINHLAKDSERNEKLRRFLFADLQCLLNTKCSLNKDSKSRVSGIVERVVEQMNDRIKAAILLDLNNFYIAVRVVDN